MRMSNGNSFRMAVAGTVFSMFFFGATLSARAQNRGNGNSSSVDNGNPAGQVPGNGAPQLPNGPSGRGVPRSPIDSMGTGDEVPKLQEQQANSRNVDRQKKLQADTERLLTLATQLKEEVDKTDKNTLSLEVIKKADEIEKLAKSVKDRMKG